jgi:hypothetical protein
MLWEVSYLFFRLRLPFLAVALAGIALCYVVTFDSSTDLSAAVCLCCAGCLLGCTSVAPLLA